MFVVCVNLPPAWCSGVPYSALSDDGGFQGLCGAWLHPASAVARTKLQAPNFTHCAYLQQYSGGGHHLRGASQALAEQSAFLGPTLPNGFHG